MANTYSQLYIHIVFAVKGRENLIGKSWRDKLFQYITGIVSNKNQKLFAINGVADNIHILLSMNPDGKLSDLVRDIKANSSRWINDYNYVKGKFEWQAGFGAFSVSASQVPTVVNYIHQQEVHHRTKTFREEYLDFLQAYEIEYKPEFLPKDFGANPIKE